MTEILQYIFKYIKVRLYYKDGLLWVNMIQLLYVVFLKDNNDLLFVPFNYVGMYGYTWTCQKGIP